MKKATIRNLRQLVHQASEELLEETGSLSLQSKAVVLGICADKLASMAGPVQEISLAPQVIQVFQNITNEFTERLIQTAQFKKPHIDL